MISENIKFREDTPEILKDYSFLVNEKIKIFCPNCFRCYAEYAARKHFLGCSSVLLGKEIFRESEIKIIRPYSEEIKSFLKKFNKFLILETSELKEFPYSQNYNYWVFQIYNKNFKTLTIGIAFIRFNKNLDHFVLPAITIFPKSMKGKGYGKLFLKKIYDCYVELGGIFVENPNKIMKKICDELKIEYYFHI
jgi:hypothetical protein